MNTKTERKKLEDRIEKAIEKLRLEYVAKEQSMARHDVRIEVAKAVVRGAKSSLAALERAWS